MARRLQRFPGNLQELAVLRIEDRRLLRAEAEEVGIEHVKAVKQRGGRHVIGAADLLGAFAGGQQVGLVQTGGSIPTPSRKLRQ